MLFLLNSHLHRHHRLGQYRHHHHLQLQDSQQKKMDKLSGPKTFGTLADLRPPVM
jgi:hypothetical protein